MVFLPESEIEQGGIHVAVARDRECLVQLLAGTGNLRAPLAQDGLELDQDEESRPDDQDARACRDPGISFLGRSGFFTVGEGSSMLAQTNPPGMNSG